ncbi:MAG TPA: AAA family ATPase [Nitrosopumilaceae archaeon]|nr:AAA family ATPase [Nitrosopumilaceae archaeon]
MDKREFIRIISKIEKEDSIFSKKAYLDTLSFPPNIVGRQKKTEELVRLLLGYKQGYVVPLVSVYGRSGSGKSTIVKFVCENLGVPYCFVNLRKAKTVFGAANLILAELGKPNLKSAQGLNLAVENIGNSIISKLEQEKKNFFVLVLDEYDVLFHDKRGRPSDFVYKLIVLEENLRSKGLMLCVVTISNNVLSDYEIDDRVRSRIGSSEVFFEPYSKSDVLEILKERTKEAFSIPVDEKVLERCAGLSSEGHGDARRAIDLLRVAAELARSKNEKLSGSHVDMASDELQKDRIGKVLANASYHFKLACCALARITYLTDEPWHSTSVLYNQYCKIVQKDTKPLGYRRISELLIELENTGLVVSQTGSKGRHGYGTQYKLVVSPDVIGKTAFAEWWKNLVEAKRKHDQNVEDEKITKPKKSSLFYDMYKTLDLETQKDWQEFVGL